MFTIQHERRLTCSLPFRTSFLIRDARAGDGHGSGEILEISLALEVEWFADHHVRLAAGLADGEHLLRLALSLVGNTLVGHLLPSGALGRSLPVVVGQVSVPLLIGGFASLGLLLQKVNHLVLNRRALAGFQLNFGDKKNVSILS